MDAAKLQLIEELTANADKVQEEVLREILSLNAETEYLKRHNLRGATDRSTFKAKVPLIDYDDVKPDIQRIADGDRSSILTAHTITEFLTSSGTSAGERKLMPVTREESDRRFGFLELSKAVARRCMPGCDEGKRLSFHFAGSERWTPGGHPVRQTSTSTYKDPRFLSSLPACTSPIEAILCLDYFQSMYAQLLCGLNHREEVLRIEAMFSSTILRAIRFLQLHYQELAHDIFTGTPSAKITDPSLRASLSCLLKPNPGLGELIKDECSTGNWEGIVCRIWPRAKYLVGIATGSMAQYVPALDHYSGGLPLVSLGYASSECFLGMNLQPLCKPSEVAYTILPNMAYFEFISTEGTAVDLADVELEKEYEVVVTTYTGLYRYRVGDVLRVAGFHNKAPEFHFVRRKNVLLSLESDKTDEAELQRGVDKASRLLEEHGTSVVEYTSCVDVESIPGHYVIYLEFSSTEPSRKPGGELMERCCLAIEEELNAMYRQDRFVVGSIGALEVRVVRDGAFDQLMHQAVSMGSSVSQYKVPRCVSLNPVVELLDSLVVSSHFSRGLPLGDKQTGGI